MRAEGDQGFAWVEPSGEGGHRVLGRVFIEGPLLLLETRSIARSRRARDLLLSVCEGGLSVVRDDSDDFSNDEEAEEKPDSTEPDDGPLSAHGVRPEDLPAFIDRHYRLWMDRPHPGLDDETPRNAVQTSAGRIQVTSLLKVLENRQTERGLPPHDFGWIWKELRLPRS